MANSQSDGRGNVAWISSDSHALRTSERATPLAEGRGLPGLNILVDAVGRNLLFDGTGVIWYFHQVNSRKPTSMLTLSPPVVVSPAKTDRNQRFIRILKKILKRTVPIALALYFIPWAAATYIVWVWSTSCETNLVPFEF